MYPHMFQYVKLSFFMTCFLRLNYLKYYFITLKVALRIADRVSLGLIQSVNFGPVITVKTGAYTMRISLKRAKFHFLSLMLGIDIIYLNPCRARMEFILMIFTMGVFYLWSSKLPHAVFIYFKALHFQFWINDKSLVKSFDSRSSKVSNMNTLIES